MIDIGTPFCTVLKAVYFFNRRRFACQHPTDRYRGDAAVLPNVPATGVMDRLFAARTASEYAGGLRLLQAKTTAGFTGLDVSGGIVRIRRSGGCSSRGSTVTVGDGIVPTLKQLPGIRYVTIFDPSGRTEVPSGARDSRPFCLEP